MRDQIVQSGVDVECIGVRTGDVGDGGVSAAKVVAENPVGALHGERDYSLINPLLNAGKYTAVTRRNRGSTQWSDLLSCSGNRITGYTEVLAACH